jgi:hypothetical protein
MSRALIGIASACTVSLLLLPGCTTTEKPIVKVEGKVKLSDGTPPPAGTKLLFNPTEGRVGTASATTDADGSFTLTHVTGSTGAEVGKYTVQLTPPEATAKEFYKLVPKDTAEGSLYAEIKEGMGPLELTVRKKKK